MKKLLVLSALVAVSTAFVACSSNDDLVQQAPEVPETKGIPMTVTVVDNASRGTDLTKETLPGFTMYSTMYDNWKTGASFTNDKGTCTAGAGVDLTWPNATDSYTFYSVSDVDNIPDLDNNGVKDVPTVNDNGDAVSFKYQIPTTYAAQKDLLVAKTTGSATTGNPAGSVAVQFDHALAQIKAIKVYCNNTRLLASNVNDGWSYRFRINGIRLGGLKAVGTYTFGNTFADGTWAVSGDDAEFEIPIPESTFADMFGVADGKKSLAIPDGGLYLIPQTVNSYVTDNPVGGGDYGIVGAYAELDAQVLQFTQASTEVGDDTNGRLWDEENNKPMPNAYTQAQSDAGGFGQIRCPLKITLEPGKGYAIVIDLSRGVIYSGDCITEAVFDNADMQVGG